MGKKCINYKYILTYINKKLNGLEVGSLANPKCHGNIISFSRNYEIIGKILKTTLTGSVNFLTSALNIFNLKLLIKISVALADTRHRLLTWWAKQMSYICCKGKAVPYFFIGI